ncbi:unnamed protein product [Cochlearia groenlandica]
MYYSHSLSKHLISVHFFAVVATQLLYICKVSSLNLTNAYMYHKCLASEGEYKPGSAYEKNLIKHISLALNGTFTSGFYHGTIGDPDYSTIIYQCRGDSYLSKCRACFLFAIVELLKRCPRNKGRIVWFDQCFVETTTVPITDAKSRTEIDYKNNFFVHNPNKVSGDAKLFNKETITFLQNLTVKANDEKNKGKNGEMALYAGGEKMIGTKKLYAMVQCIRDTFVMYEKKLCKKCLDTIIMDFPKCCDGKQGGRVLGTSCDFRYELYPFLKT